MRSTNILLFLFTLIETQLEIECGKVQTQGQSLIRYGQNTTKGGVCNFNLKYHKSASNEVILGDWPWHAALYFKPAKDAFYLCGGSLISQFHVITAAHCLTVSRQSTISRKPDQILIYLGLHNLKMMNEANVEKHEISQIRIHPEYDPTPKNDLAIIKVKSYVDFNEHVWPICLKGNSEGKTGIVVGWGFNENNAITDVLLKTNLPILDFSKCLSSDKKFFSQYQHQKTYCAGYTNGTSICTGDSGGGMYIDHDETWYLRGVVSAAVYIPNTTVCHASHYVIFTDVTQNLNWIKDIIK